MTKKQVSLCKNDLHFIQNLKRKLSAERVKDEIFAGLREDARTVKKVSRLKKTA